jgi:GT2 family glycosyltransferase
VDQRQRNAQARVFGKRTFSLWRRLIAELMPSPRVSGWVLDVPQASAATSGVLEVGYVGGACVLARRTAIQQVGYLDEQFWLYWEDVDWCLRMWRAGWKVLWCPRALVVHTCGGSSRQTPLLSGIAILESGFRFYRKHFGKSRAWLYRATVLYSVPLRLVARLFCARLDLEHISLYAYTVAWALSGRGTSRLLRPVMSRSSGQGRGRSHV